MSRDRGFVTNIYRPEFDEPREHDGFRARRARIGRQLGTERIGLSLWEIPPGEAAYPYHFHLGEEEVVVVLAGTPTLRSREGTRVLATGETIRFPRGEDGTHQLLNEGSDPARVLALSTNGEPDIVIYPDSEKLGVAERRLDGGGVKEMFRSADGVSYWEGENRGSA
jgi:uncharacterized cupin superfamily protein